MLVSPLFVHAIFDKNLERQVTEWCTKEVGLTFLGVWSTAARLAARSLNNLAVNYKDEDIFGAMHDYAKHSTKSCHVVNLFVTCGKYLIAVVFK